MPALDAVVTLADDRSPSRFRTQRPQLAHNTMCNLVFIFVAIDPISNPNLKSKISNPTPTCTCAIRHRFLKPENQFNIYIFPRKFGFLAGRERGGRAGIRTFVTTAAYNGSPRVISDNWKNLIVCLSKRAAPGDVQNEADHWSCNIAKQLWQLLLDVNLSQISK